GRCRRSHQSRLRLANRHGKALHPGVHQRCATRAVLRRCRVGIVYVEPPRPRPQSEQSKLRLAEVASNREHMLWFRYHYKIGGSWTVVLDVGTAVRVQFDSKMLRRVLNPFARWIGKVTFQAKRKRFAA